MTVIFSNQLREKKTHRKARRAAHRFLRENHAALAALLRLLGHHALAARLASLFELASRGRVNLAAINGAFAEAHSYPSQEAGRHSDASQGCC